jgi:hypothetical protein
VVISVEAASSDNVIHLEYLTSQVLLEEPGIRRTDPNIPSDIKCTDGEHHFTMPAGSVEFDDEGDESREHTAICAAIWW